MFFGGKEKLYFPNFPSEGRRMPAGEFSWKKVEASGTFQEVRRVREQLR
jgi:hypothetical protein